MQTKKEEVKKSLLDTAKKEFLEKGFEKTSIRKIVKEAGTTIGNFYNYFDSKENIFSELVEEVHKEFISLINNNHKIKNKEIVLKTNNIALLKKELFILLKKFLPILDDRFIILLDKSKGTKYSSAKNDLIDVISKHFIEHIKEYAPNYEYPELGKVFAFEIITGFLEIIKSTTDNLKKEKLIIEQILFTSFGIMGVLQGISHD